MSTYEYTDDQGDKLWIAPRRHQEQVSVIAQMGQFPACIFIPNADVLTVAAELLKVAGHDYLAGYIEADIDCRERAEAEAAEKKLQERRDALAKDLSDSYWDYEGANMPTKRAIDRIIELEDGASRD